LVFDPGTDNPSAATHPQALRVSSFLVRGMVLCGYGMGVGFLCYIVFLVGGVLARGHSWGDLFFVVASACFWGFFGSLAVYALLACVRMVLIALVFVRYSLAQLLSVVLLGGTFMTLIIKLPEGWKVLPGIALAVLVFGVLFYTAGHDPEDRSDLAQTIRKDFGPATGGKVGSDSRDPH
jgi:hypothetical protein